MNKLCLNQYWGASSDIPADGVCKYFQTWIYFSTPARRDFKKGWNVELKIFHKSDLWTGQGVFYFLKYKYNTARIAISWKRHFWPTKRKRRPILSTLSPPKTRENIPQRPLLVVLNAHFFQNPLNSRFLHNLGWFNSSKLATESTGGLFQMTQLVPLLQVVLRIEDWGHRLSWRWPRDHICHKHHKQRLCKIIITRVKIHSGNVF